MKKLVLVIVCIFLMALFVAFNYLLWDRESILNEMKNLESVNVSNNANMSAQNREIKSLGDENGKLQDSITNLEDTNEQLTQKTTKLEYDMSVLSKNVGHKIEIINVLKENVDIKLFETPVKKWVEALDAGKYNEAYSMEMEMATYKEHSISLEKYISDLKDTIKSIKVKEAKLDKSQGTKEGEIYLTVTLDVKIIEGADISNSRFVNGLNEFSFGLDYSNIKNEFFINSISPVKK